MARTKTVNETEHVEVPVFTKAQLVKAKRYETKRDALQVVLNDGEAYTHEEVETLLEKFYKGGNK